MRLLAALSLTARVQGGGWPVPVLLRSTAHTPRGDGTQYRCVKHTRVCDTRNGQRSIRLNMRLSRYILQGKVADEMLIVYWLVESRT